MTHIINLKMSNRQQSNKLLSFALVLLMASSASALNDWTTSEHFSANPSTTDSKWPSSLNNGQNIPSVTVNFLGGMKLYESTFPGTPRPKYDYSRCKNLKFERMKNGTVEPLSPPFPHFETIDYAWDACWHGVFGPEEEGQDFNLTRLFYERF